MTKENIKTLKYEKRIGFVFAGIILAFGLFFNLFFIATKLAKSYEKDELLVLIAIDLLIVGLSYLTTSTMNRKINKDLREGIKIIRIEKINKKVELKKTKKMVLSEAQSLSIVKYDLKRMVEAGICQDVELEKIVRQAEEILNKMESYALPYGAGIVSEKNENLWGELRLLTEYLTVKQDLKSLTDDSICKDAELQETVRQAEEILNRMEPYVFPYGKKADKLWSEFRTLHLYLRNQK